MCFVKSVEAYLTEIVELEQEERPARRRLIALYQDMIRDHPSASVVPYVGLAYFAYRTHRVEEALLFLKQAMKIEPFSRPVQQLYRKIQSMSD